MMHRNLIFQIKNCLGRANANMMTIFCMGNYSLTEFLSAHVWIYTYVIYLLDLSLKNRMIFKKERNILLQPL